MRPTGYGVVTGPEGVVEELDTLTCAHCGSVYPVGKQVKDPGGFCRLCMKPICGPCSDKNCTPFEKRLERMEARGRFLREVGV